MTNKESQYYNVPAEGKQWQEKSYEPIVVDSITRVQILEIQAAFAKSYHCNIKEITTKFNKISNKDDDDRGVCLLLTYNYTYMDRGKMVNRVIFSIKVPVPEDIKQRAESATNARKNAQRCVPMLTNGEIDVVTCEARPITDPTTQILPLNTLNILSGEQAVNFVLQSAIQQVSSDTVQSVQEIVEPIIPESTPIIKPTVRRTKAARGRK
jgi:hypothetical protein